MKEKAYILYLWQFNIISDAKTLIYIFHKIMQKFPLL